MLRAENLQLGYEEKIVIEDFSLDLKEGEVVSIVGPNGCGKSTILKSISGLLTRQAGSIYLDSKDLDKMDLKDVARRMSLLSQHNRSPEDISVRDLVHYGRIPHKKWYERQNSEDQAIVDWALRMTSLEAFENKLVMELSGGERQKVWLAMALAQRPRLLLLDEPTSYLDIYNQIEILELIKKLNQELGLSVIMVLHDLGQAAKYSHRLVVIDQGRKAAEGCPRKILTEELIRDVYQVEVCIRKNILEDEFIIHPIKLCNRKGCRKRCLYDYK